MTEPWVLFEAGALSKKLSKARVCPVLVGLRPTDVQGPLSRFQMARLEKEDIRKLVVGINKACGEPALEKGALDRAFEKWWPDLEKEVREIGKKSGREERPAVRTDRELLEEIVSTVRQVSRVRVVGSSVARGAVEFLVAKYVQLVATLGSEGVSASAVGTLEKLRNVIGHIVDRSERSAREAVSLKADLAAVSLPEPATRGEYPDDVPF